MGWSVEIVPVAEGRRVNGPRTGAGVTDLYDRELSCLADPGVGTLPIETVRPAGLADFCAALPAAQAAFLQQSGFVAAEDTVVLLPGKDGVAGAVLGLGRAAGPDAYGALAGLPPDTDWHLGESVPAPQDALLGFCLGAYRYDVLKSGPPRRGPRLAPPAGAAHTLSAARATWLVRDLINLPANILGPAELARAAAQVLTRSIALRRGATVRVVEGEALEAAYPAIAAVGRGSHRAPCVVVAEWRGPATDESTPLISLCGKGVCFDTGGYDLKPSAAMLRMKKDMAGAAVALGLARMIIDAALPVRLAVRLGCVENSVSGNAMRPLDILHTRGGLRVEVGNTDAEGRLVLCDLLSEASEANPAMLLDFATLTGAARVALGPEVSALFSNDESLAASLLAGGEAAHDPVWRLPLWRNYNKWLDSTVADMNNVSGKPYAGAVVAALFLERFVGAGIPWAHCDIYGWNDSTAPGRPEGGEAKAMRAAYWAISRLAEVAETGRETNKL
jgi:leucyl aminopeptidase